LSSETTANTQHSSESYSSRPLFVAENRDVSAPADFLKQWRLPNFVIVCHHLYSNNKMLCGPSYKQTDKCYMYYER